MNKKKEIDKVELFRRLGKFIDVYNMDSKNRQGETPNQFIVEYENGNMFRSYKSDIAAYIKGQLYVNECYHDYSVTTMRYCKRYTGLTAQQRRDGIENGTIITFET